MVEETKKNPAEEFLNKLDERNQETDDLVEETDPTLSYRPNEKELGIDSIEYDDEVDDNLVEETEEEYTPKGDEEE